MKLRTIAAALAAVVLLAAPYAGAGEDEVSVHEKLLAAKADTVVNLKFVLKMQITMQGQTRDQEQNSEVRGVLIGDSGLVLTSNTNFGGIPESVRRQYNLEVKATPVELKILFSNEVEEYDAQLVARDSNLNLAFVQILDLKGREVKGVDLRTGVEPRVGREIIGVSRMSRGFDCAPVVGRLFVTAKIEKPRAMWAVNGNFSALAHPVYNQEGQLVGILSIQEGSEGVSGGGMMGGGNQNLLPVVLPLSDVVRSLKQAEERAAEALEAYAEAGEDDEAGEAGDAEEGSHEDGDEGAHEDGEGEKEPEHADEPDEEHGEDAE